MESVVNLVNFSPDLVFHISDPDPEKVRIRILAVGFPVLIPPKLGWVKTRATDPNLAD